ncbi:MAG: TetR/AcrR family transcriptional regulator [Coriobacteriales bacterium]|jgi:TetR/AcrR family transcriptional repressor of lmrAB and yxaGH operons|nr:TetR/AcrR family transcriptional regulator [Coriobacteriales bacterium]
MSNGADTKSRIIETAFVLFQSYGYHAVGVNQIIEDSHTPKGSLYYHFPGGKEEIALEVLQRAERLVTENITISMAQHKNAADAFDNLLRKLKKNIFSEQGHFSVTLLALETAHVSEQLRQASVQALDAWIALYEQKLLEAGYGQARARTLAIAIETHIDGSINMAIIFEDPKYLDRARTVVAEMLTTT